jgi:transposase-like protein
MANKRYTDADRAVVFAELTVLDGNIKRTARNLNMPVSTVRYFKQQWEREGVPKEVIDALPAQITDFVTHAERVRDKLLVALESAVDRGEIKPREIVVSLGMLTDKIRAYRGLDAKKVEHTLALPDVEEMRELFSGVIQEVVGAAEIRNAELAADIDDGEWESALKALPQPVSKTEVLS